MDWVHYEGPAGRFPSSIVMVDYGVAHLSGFTFELTRGGQSCHNEAGVYCFEPGDVVTLRGSSPGSLSLGGLHIAPSAFERAAADRGIPRAALRVCHHALKEPRLVSALEDLWHQTSVSGSSKMINGAYSALLDALFLFALQAPTVTAEPHFGLHRARDLILEKPKRELTLDELAAQSGLSKAYFVRSFHKTFGIPPHMYLMHSRLGRARHLLQQGWKPIDAAFEVGFCDQSHMTRWFLRVFGVSPRTYARSTVF